MKWAIERDGYTAEWIEPRRAGPFVRVTGPRIPSDGKEFAIGPTGTHDGCDFMHACITNAIATLPEWETVGDARERHS